eukprot:PhF_6_TR40183/c0_g1_i1/m.59599/K04857/CACNA1S; voltage-dependent calcium channel L type alpha-1S
MALETPTIQDDNFQSVLAYSDTVFLSIFMTEMVLRILAQGFVLHSGAYLRSAWNAFDFCIIMSSLLSTSLQQDNGGVSTLRVLRVLRPLRTINRIKGLKVIVSTLLNSIPMMRDVFLLLGFLMSAFAIFGMQIWSDDVHFRCFALVPSDNSSQNGSWVLIQNDSLLCGDRVCSPENNGVYLPQQCLYEPVPMRPVFNFDHFGNAVLWVFKIVSLDNWPDDLKTYMSAIGNVAFLYPLLITLLGGYVCLNLIIAILSSQFSQEGKSDLDAPPPPATLKPLTPGTFLGRTYGKTFGCIGFDSLRDLPMDIIYTRRKSSVTLQSMVASRRISEFIETVRRASTIAPLEQMAVEADAEGGEGNMESAASGGSQEHSPPYGSEEQSPITPAPVSSPLIKFVSWCKKGFPWLQTYVCSFWFNVFVLLATFANAVFLSLDHYGINSTLQGVINTASIALTIFFLVEAVIKIAALGPILYISDRYNWLDAALCIVSIPDLAGGGGSAFSALRAFRLFRALRLARNWASLQRLLHTVVESVQSVTFLSVIMLLVIYIFAILGFQLFHTDVPGMRFSFASVFESLLTVFIIISGENWTDIMESLMQITSYGAFVYFVALTIVGNFVFLNLFIAIILEKFASAEDDQWEDESTKNEFSVPDFLSPKSKFMQTQRSRQVSIVPPNPSGGLGSRKNSLDSNGGGRNALLLKHASFKSKRTASLTTHHRTGMTERDQAQERLKWIGTEKRALYCLEPDNPFRSKVILILQWVHFDKIILIFILLSAVSLCLDSPVLIQRHPEYNDVIEVLDAFIACVFAIEMMMKIIGFGLVNHKGSYLRDPWNVLDAFVVITSFLALEYDSFKLTRSVRVMRLLSQSQALKLALTSLIQSIPGMGNVIVLGVLLFWIFGIIGVALFKGEFYECTDNSIGTKTDCIGVFNTTTPGIQGDDLVINASRMWQPRGPTFDHLGQAMLTLVHLGVKDGWFDTMYHAIDAQGIDIGPSRNANQANSLYFIVFVIVGGFFLINLFIGVLVDRFSAMKAQGEGFALMSNQQKDWVLVQKLLLRTALPLPIEPPVNIIRQHLHKLAFHPGFEVFFTIIIIINCGILSAKYEAQPDDYDSVMYDISIALLCLFTIEVAIKMVAFLPLRYFQDGWNVFDFLVVLLSWIGMAAGGSGASIARLFRIGRLFMLVKRAKGLQTLLVTLFQALPAFLNTVVLLLIFYFIFGVVGVELFGRVERNNALDSMTNFETVWNAWITLYVVGTTESWMDIMWSTENPTVAIPYFLVYLAVGSMIVLNLLVTVITESFDDASTATQYSDRLLPFSALRDQWIQFDPNHKRVVQAQDCLHILFRLPEPLWYKSSLLSSHMSTSDFVLNLHQLRRLHVPINGENEVRYKDVVAALALVVFGIEVEEGIEASQKTSEGVTWNKDHFTIHHYYAAKFLLHVWRTHKANRTSSPHRLTEEDVARLRDTEPIWQSSPKNLDVQSEDLSVHYVDIQPHGSSPDTESIREFDGTTFI